MIEALKFEIAKLSLGPDDVLVVRVKHAPSDLHSRKRLNDVLKGAVGEGPRILVIDHEVELSVLTKEQVGALLSSKDAT